MTACKILIVDTETTGLTEKNAHPNETEKYPYIVQLSYICALYNDNKLELTKTEDFIVRVPDDVIISDVVVNIHGISNEISRKKGVSIEHALNTFIKDAKEADLIVAHNTYFDLRLIRAELHRMQNKCRPSNRSYDNIQENINFMKNAKNIHCTMMTNIKLCNVKAVNKYGTEYTKFPKLSELHNHIFHYVPNNLHNSFNDVIVCLRCFMKLRYDIDIFANSNSNLKKLYNRVA